MRENGNRRLVHRPLMLLLAILLAAGLLAPGAGLHASAARARNASAAPKLTFGWTVRNQQVYYYNEKGVKVTGLQKIGRKSYYFDKEGVQHTGWQKIGSSYYFFVIANGKQGCMAVSQTVNGIRLGKDGKAALGGNSQAKLNVMIKANKIMESATKPTQTKAQKLRACFDYSLKHFMYRGALKFVKSAHWEQSYALDMFDRRHGNCYAYGAAFAFLANAVGCTNVCAVSSGGHGWAEVDGKVYDLSWEQVDRKHSYYAMPMNLSGVDGRPGYKNARVYVVKI